MVQSLFTKLANKRIEQVPTKELVKYRVKKNGWDASGLSYRFLSLWEGITSVKNIFADNIIYKIGSGEDVFFWQDVWMEDKPLMEEFSSLLLCL